MLPWRATRGPRIRARRLVHGGARPCRAPVGARAGRVEVVEFGADHDGSTRRIDAQGDGDGPSTPEPPSCGKHTHTPRSAHEPRAHAARSRGRAQEMGSARLISRLCTRSAHLRACPRAGASNAPRKPSRLSRMPARSAAQKGPCAHAISRRRQWAPTRMHMSMHMRPMPGMQVEISC